MIISHGDTPGTLRPGEWVQIIYFAYVAVISLWFPLASGVRWVPFVVAVGVAACWWLLARQKGPGWALARDWVALAFTLTAYREMDLFTRPMPDHALERAWVVWDRQVLTAWGGRAAIEWLGPLLPTLLELCYLLVYAVMPFSLAVLYSHGRTDRIPRFLVIWILGTLGSYALFPYFPSDTPRRVFADMDMPQVMTAVRRFNLLILGGYGIHSSVFPSAHVSSAFSAALGMKAALPERPYLALGMLIYAALVAVATVYGRYHYVVDAFAGLSMSLLTYAAWRIWPSRHGR